MSSRKNIESVEMMRGIAAMMVAYFHIARGNRDFLDPSSVFFRAGAWGWAGVEIFFVISGFIIMYAMFYGGYTLSRVHKFLAKRLIRLEPPYIVSIAVVLVLMYVSTLMPTYRGKPFNPDWWNVLGHLGYVNAFTGEKWLQDVYWSLAIEFEFYLGLALLFPLLMNKNKWVSWLAMTALLAMSFIPTEGTHVFSYLPFFAMGILLSLYKVGRYNKIEFFCFLNRCYSVMLPRVQLCFVRAGFSYHRSYPVPENRPRAIGLAGQDILFIVPAAYTHWWPHH